MIKKKFFRHLDRKSQSPQGSKTQSLMSIGIYYMLDTVQSSTGTCSLFTAIPSGRYNYPPWKYFLNKLLTVSHGLKKLQTEPCSRTQGLPITVERTGCCQRDPLSCGYFPEGSVSEHITRVGMTSTREIGPTPKMLAQKQRAPAVLALS